MRDCDGSIVQFYYGEDSIDPAKHKFFEKLDFLKNNFETLKKKYKHEELKGSMKIDAINSFKKDESPNKTIMEKFRPGVNLGSVS